MKLVFKHLFLIIIISSIIMIIIIFIFVFLSRSVRVHFVKLRAHWQKLRAKLIITDKEHPGFSDIN